MTSVLLIQLPDPDAPALAEDIAAAGFSLLGTAERQHLVREALRGAPDVVLCWAPRPDAALFEALRTLQAQQPLPVLVFTQDADAARLHEALQAGVHAWVVQGYAPQRLRPLVQLAQARQAHEQNLRAELAELADRFEERKLVDKAKGILMRARQLSEDDAFRLLRTASMHGNQRVGQVSRQVIDAAEAGEAINRAGQLRMLSQRLVKLQALVLAKADAPAAQALLTQSVQRAEEILAQLPKAVSEATFGDLLSALQSAWTPLRAQLKGPFTQAQLPAFDAQAEALLRAAEALVTALENSGLAGTVHVINTAGRQRMLSQRMAKAALLGATDVLARTQHDFEEGMARLAQAPLSSDEIRTLLLDARTEWDALLEAAPRATGLAGARRVAAASEALLAQFDRLTAAYQHSMQVLMG